ncbi:MAG: carboxypeptidase regulatory-like domain-containing protein [Nibricoccus sp.]
MRSLRISLTYLLAVFTALVAFNTQLHAQGMTSSSMIGFITGADGAPVVGAAVTVVHQPTNSTFTATTNASGRFTVSGLPVGGPFKVSATAENTVIRALTEIYTTLGDVTDVTLVAEPSKEDVIKMEKFEVQASSNDLDANAAGAASVLDNRRLAIQPTANRSFADLIKTNSFVSVRGYPQIQALGVNNRYNSITLDGAKINDSYGLNSSGLFSLNNPFSVDAIEQLSISLTPYDVRQSGFAGAAINAVSKSGTNEFHGTTYFVFTDHNWQGKDVFGSNIGKRSLLKERTYGFTLGGPILPNRLFFFLNFEKYYRDTVPSRPGITPDQSFLDALYAKIATLPGSPQLGSFGAAGTPRLADTKRLAKIDWNITNGQRLAVRYSDTIGKQPNFGSFSSTSFSQPVSSGSIPSSGFSNGTTSLNSNFYTLNVKEHVWAAQLFSNWTADFKTQLSYSQTEQESVRDVPVKFPEIRILNVPGVTSSGSTVTPTDNSTAIRFGTETSSQGNELRIKTRTMGGSGDYTLNDFILTAGADHEKSDYYNLFRQGSYGIFSYANLAAFIADTPAGFARAVVRTGLPTADISEFQQTGLFAQAKWQPNSRLNITVGLRGDFMKSPIAPIENVNFKNAFGVTNAGTIDGTQTIAPRFSFNIALDKERLTQVRGGAGIFLGRNPWVWISNSYGNTGVGRFNQLVTGATTPTLAQYLQGTYSNTDRSYRFDPANPIGLADVDGSASAISLITPGLKMPTIRRANLAVDRKIPALDATLSIEYVDTKQTEALFVDNMNLKPTTVGADGRQRFAGASSGTNALVPAFGNVIRTRNVGEGGSQYVSISLDRPFKKGWAYNVSYTRGHATEAQTLNSSTATSQWQFNSVFNQNAVEVARSDYEVRNRVQATLSKEFRVRKDFVTTVSLYYEGRTGQPYSFVYSGDLNGDGFNGNDLVAVPTGLDDPRFDFSGMNDTQRSAYFAFINSSGLYKNAGAHSFRNGFSTPWQNRLDLRFTQDIPTVRKVKLQLFADFINFGTWLSRRYFNYIEEINASTTNGGLTRAFGNASYTSTGLIRPTVTTNPDGTVNFASASQIAPNNGDSRWKIVAGAKIAF